ncbi:DUF3892 domain-containing protein [Flavobacterium sp. 3-218]
MSTFYVTAVRYTTNGSYISHLMVHVPESEKGRLKKGVIMTKNDVITLLKQKKTLTTAVYNYTGGFWSRGSDIGIVVVNNIEYLRTDPDKTSRDNLANLLLIDEIR